MKESFTINPSQKIEAVNTTSPEASLETEVKTAIEELKKKLKELNLTKSIEDAEDAEDIKKLLEADDETLKALSNDETLEEIKKINAELDEKIKKKATNIEAENGNEAKEDTNIHAKESDKVESTETSSSEKDATVSPEKKEDEKVEKETEPDKEKENESDAEEVELDYKEEAKLVADEYEKLLDKYENDETLSPEVKDLIKKGYGDINLVRTYQESDPKTHKNRLIKYTNTIRERHEKLSSLLEPEKANKEKGESLKDSDKRDLEFIDEMDTEALIDNARSTFETLRQRIEGLNIEHPDLEEFLKEGEVTLDILNNYPKEDDGKVSDATRKYLTKLRRVNASLSGILTTKIDKNDTKRFGKYQEARKEWKESRDSYKAKEAEYKKALNDHYADKSWGAKARKVKEGIGKFFGIDPKLPPEIQKTKDEFQSLKKAYAEKLDKAMFKRSHVRYGDAYGGEVNKEYRLDSNSSKIAFGKKFILKPHQQFLEIQKAHGMSPEMKKRLGRIGGMFSKYKWHTRGGVILMAGLAGLFTGGVVPALVGASSVGARMVAGTIGGAYAGKKMYESKQNSIKEAEKRYASASDNSTNKFSLDSLGELENQLEKAEINKDMQNFQQKAWSVTAGGLVGGAAGVGVGAYAPDVISPSIASSVESAKVNISSFGESVEESIKNSGIEVMDAKEKIFSPYNIDLQDITIPDYSSTGEQISNFVLKDIDIHAKGTLSLEDQTLLQKEITRLSGNILSEYRNVSASVLSEKVTEQIVNKYGNEEWWHQAKIGQITIGDIENNNAPKASNSVYSTENLQDTQKQFGKNEVGVTGKSELPYGKTALNDIQEQHGKDTAEVNSKSELPYGKEELGQIQSDHSNHVETSGSEQIYKVQNGDNLWQITKDQFASELKGLSPDAQNRVLDQLLDRVRIDRDLRASLELENFDDPTDNISSAEEIDHIKAGDEIHLDKLGEELKSLVEQEKNPLSQPMNGTIEVSTDTPNEVNVPIETGQEYKVVAEAVNYNTTPGFHIKADGLSENVINEMKAYSQQLATDHIKENPDFAHDTEALRHAVWNDFRKMYPDVHIQEFGFDRPTLDNYAQNLKTHGVEIVTEGGGQAQRGAMNEMNTSRNVYPDPNQYPNQYPSHAPNNILYGNQLGMRDWGLTRGSRIQWVDPYTGAKGMHSGYGSTYQNGYGARLSGGRYPVGYGYGGSYYGNGGGYPRGGMYPRGIGGGMYGRGAIGPLEYNNGGHNRFGGRNFYGPNRVFIPPTETELRMLAEREAEMYNQQTAPPVDYIQRPDTVAEPRVNTVESPQPTVYNNEVENQLAGNETVSDTNIENLQKIEHEKIINDFQKIYQTETPGEAERILDTEMSNFVKSVEKIDNGFFSRLSGGETSPYEYFGTATVSQFEEYMNQNITQLKPFLEQNDMKYETFLNLKNAVQEVSSTVPHDKNTTIENLFANYLIQYAENNTNPSGFDERTEVASEAPVNAVESMNNEVSYPAVELVGDTIKVGELNLRYGGLSQEQTRELYNFAKEQANEIVKEDPNITVTQLSDELRKRISDEITESGMVKNITSSNISYARRQ